MRQADINGLHLRFVNPFFDIYSRGLAICTFAALEPFLLLSKKFIEKIIKNHNDVLFFSFTRSILMTLNGDSLTSINLFSLILLLVLQILHSLIPAPFYVALVVEFIFAFGYSLEGCIFLVVLTSKIHSLITLNFFHCPTTLQIGEVVS